jgi:hypothetical protein
VLDARREPALYLRLDPPDGASTDPYTARKSLLGFELVDHRAAETCHSADLRQAKDLCRQQGRSERIRKW